jgi:DNA-binding response OmpR family regulator
MNGPDPERTWDIVLAEDDDDHALLIEMALGKAATSDVEVRRARNGDEALDLVREQPPDLLLLDLKMPGKAGHEVLDELKNDEELRSVPVAVLTSSDRDEDIAKSYGLGTNHFITKPGSPAELEDRLRVLLRNLAELHDIRRGAGYIEFTAVSTIDPETALRRKVLAIGVTLGVIVILLLFAFFSGALS